MNIRNKVIEELCWSRSVLRLLAVETGGPRLRERRDIRIKGPPA